MTDRPFPIPIPHDDIWCDITPRSPTKYGSDFRFDTMPAPLFDLSHPRFEEEQDDGPPTERMS